MPTGRDTGRGFESQLDDITMRLAAFEGPLDLLLHLIKKNEVNVYDIPIALITEQYLEYLDLMQELNLDVASEFLVMAATLIHIKSRDAAAAARTGAGATTRRSTRAMRSCAGCSSTRSSRRRPSCCTSARRCAARSGRAPTPGSRPSPASDYEPELEVDLFSLLAAFRQVLERARERPPIPLPPEQISIETRIEQLLERLSETEACGFDDLFDDVASRGDLIVTFLALLEMIRLKLIRVFQQGSSARSASTSGRGPRTRRIRSTIPKTSTRRTTGQPWRRRRPT